MLTLQIGCVGQGKAKNYVYLSSHDLDWVTDIKNIVVPDGKIRTQKNKVLYTFEFFSSIISNWLINHECIPNKTLTAKLPTIPDQYFMDFIRGVIDGDGSIYTKYRAGKTKTLCLDAARAYICSSAPEFILPLSVKLNDMGYKNKLSLEGDLVSVKKDGLEIHRTNPHYRIYFHAKEAYKLLKAAYYPNNKISLSRKNDAATKLIHYYENDYPRTL